MNYLAHVISAEEKARLDEVTNLPSMYNGPIDACPTQAGNFASAIYLVGRIPPSTGCLTVRILGERASTSILPSRFESNFEILACHFFFRWRDDARE